MGFFRRIWQSIFGPKLPPPVALVLLLRNPREIHLGLILNSLRESLTDPVKGEDLAIEDPTKIRWKADGWDITFLSIPFRYLPESKPGREARANAIADEHQAALLIDVWAVPEGLDRIKDGIARAGQIAVPLIDDDCVGIYCFNTQRVNPISEDLLDEFRAGRALEVMHTVAYDPIIHFKTDDPRMRAAIEEARQRWPEFVAAFEASQDKDSMWIAKFRFGEDEENAEHMWISVELIEDDQVTGTLQNEPMWTPGLRAGVKVTVPVSDLSDWLYLKGEEPVGAFTQQVMEKDSP